MNISKKLLPVLALVVGCPAAFAEDNAYPPMQFFSSISKDKMLEALREEAAFAELDNDALGSPITIRIRHYTKITAGGSAAALSSAVLSGSTLGLIPVVSNDDLVINYEVMVHGDPIVSFEYIENFTDVDSLYDTDYNKLEGPALEWAEATVQQFLADVRDHEALNSLFSEYRFYFANQ